MGDSRPSRRVLVIDDEPKFTSLLKLNLEETGAYKVREENSGLWALAAAKAFRPDLIFLDVIMPDVDGSEIMAQLKADADLKDIPVVFLTAVISREEVAEQQGLIGGHPFLAKPASLQEVVACIEACLCR